MAEKISLTLQPRTAEGKQVKQLRKEGQVPGVIYGPDMPAESVQALATEIEKVVRQAGKHHIVEVTINGANKATLIKSIDMDPVKHRVRHVAFHAVNRNEKVTTDIPVVLLGEGESPAERAGLVVLQAIENLEVQALPADLPDSLQVNVESLSEAGDRLTVADIKLPKGVEYTHPEDVLDLVLANVYEPSALQAANDAAGGDAETSDATAVAADNGEDTPQDTQAGESNPGGKGQAEPKQSNTDANK